MKGAGGLAVAGLLAAASMGAGFGMGGVEIPPPVLSPPLPRDHDAREAAAADKRARKAARNERLVASGGFR